MRCGGLRCCSASCCTRCSPTSRFPGWFRILSSRHSQMLVGGPRAGETGGGSSGLPRCVRILRNRFFPAWPRASRAMAGMTLSVNRATISGRAFPETNGHQIASWDSPASRCRQRNVANASTAASRSIGLSRRIRGCRSPFQCARRGCRSLAYFLGEVGWPPPVGRSWNMPRVRRLLSSHRFQPLSADAEGRR